MKNKLKASIETHYQGILSVALIILLVLIVYWLDLQILAGEAVQAEALSHILLVPFFAGFLFYTKRDLVKGSLALEKYRKKTKISHVDEIVGVIICIVAFLLYWYGSYTFYPLEYHILSIPIFIMGATLILSNSKVLISLFFPILLLLFLVPPPTEFFYTLGGLMGNFNTQASYTLLKISGLPVTLSSSYGPPIIELLGSTGQSISFAIDVPCSGVYTLVAFAMFASFLAIVAKASVLKKIGLFVSGFLIFEILNILRITMIVLIGYWFGEEVAMILFHTIAGLLLIFLGMLLTLLLAEKILKIRMFSTSQENQTCPKCNPNPEDAQSFCLECGRFLKAFQTKISKRFWMKLFVLLIGCSIATLTIHAPTFAMRGDTIQVTSGWENTETILPQAENYTLRFVARDENFEKEAHQDASLMYAYLPDQPEEPRQTVHVILGVADSISNLHSWELCLIAWQTAQGQYPSVSVIDSRDIQLLTTVPLIARYLVFESPVGYTQMTLYWYERATFNTGISVEQKYVMISLVILPSNPTEYTQLEDELLTLGQKVASYWKPLESRSLISLGIPTLQLLLVLSTVFAISAKVAQYINDLRKRTSNLKIFKKFAPPEEKYTLQTILNLSKEKGLMETRDIAEAITQETKKPPELDRLKNTLEQLEEYGFIERDLISADNRPKLVWKTKILRI